MKILLIRSVGIRGEGHREGEELDLPRDEAMNLVNMGKAVCDVDDKAEEGVSIEEEIKAKIEARKKAKAEAKVEVKARAE
ncbi:MAG: hypothetical protein FD147_2242 [Chloroflexi bacterium]|nr:MAG: hypothetical protein FD147_2242 [Chloroflexota bacterium]